MCATQQVTISDLNLLTAQAKALTLLNAWRANDMDTIATIRAEFVSAYEMCGYTEADLGKLVEWLVERGL